MGGLHFINGWIPFQTNVRLMASHCLDDSSVSLVANASCVESQHLERQLKQQKESIFVFIGVIRWRISLISAIVIIEQMRVHHQHCFDFSFGMLYWYNLLTIFKSIFIKEDTWIHVKRVLHVSKTQWDPLSVRRRRWS